MNRRSFGVLNGLAAQVPSGKSTLMLEREASHG